MRNYREATAIQFNTYLTAYFQFAVTFLEHPASKDHRLYLAIDFYTATNLSFHFLSCAYRYYQLH